MDTGGPGTEWEAVLERGDSYLGVLYPQCGNSSVSAAEMDPPTFLDKKRKNYQKGKFSQICTGREKGSPRQWGPSPTAKTCPKRKSKLCRFGSGGDPP